MRQALIVLGVLALIIFILINFSIFQASTEEIERSREACENKSAGDVCQIDGEQGACVNCKVGVICQADKT